MKTFKQLVESVFFAIDESYDPINLDEELSHFNKVVNEEGTIGYVNEKLKVPMKHEHLHEWVTAAGYRYETKTFKPGMVTEHVYHKHGGPLGEHHLLIVTKGDQRDVWQVHHETVK